MFDQIRYFIIFVEESQIETQKVDFKENEIKEEEWANLSKEELIQLLKESREENKRIDLIDLWMIFYRIIFS